MVALIVFGLSLVGGTAFGDETAVSRVTTSQVTTNGANATSAQLDGGAVVQYQAPDEVQAMKAGKSNQSYVSELHMARSGGGCCHDDWRLSLAIAATGNQTGRLK